MRVAAGECGRIVNCLDADRRLSTSATIARPAVAFEISNCCFEREATTRIVDARQRPGRMESDGARIIRSSDACAAHTFTLARATHLRSPYVYLDRRLWLPRPRACDALNVESAPDFRDTMRDRMAQESHRSSFIDGRFGRQGWSVSSRRARQRIRL